MDVLSQEALTSQGTTELAEALSDAAPSLNFPRPSITDGTDHIRPATLRGLAPDQTLVLVNSKRRHPSALVNVNGSVGRGSAAVDLNAIPLAAIESVEVLRDGASAQDGSDAIAVVINLRLRDAREGGSTTVTYGEYNTEVETERGQRHATDGGTLTASAWVGLPLGAEGFLTLTANIVTAIHEPRRLRQSRAGLTGDFALWRCKCRRHHRVRERRCATVGHLGYLRLGWLPKRQGDSAAFPRIFNDVQRAGYLPERVPASHHHRHRRSRRGLGRARQAGAWDSDVSLVTDSMKLPTASSTASTTHMARLRRPASTRAP